MHRIRCKCGTVSGQLSGKGTSNRVVCYCTDCRAFSHFLGRPSEVLDAQGGTEIVQVAQPRLTFSQGKEHLAAVRLSEKGLVRWYAACCKTPIGNTLFNPKVPFIGLIHSSLDRSRMDADFGKSVSKVNTDTATGEPKPKPNGLFISILRFLWIVLSTRISGRHRKSELFNEFGAPIVRPTVLTAEELRQLKSGAA